MENTIMKTLILAAVAASLTLQAQTTATAKDEPNPTKITEPTRRPPQPQKDGTVKIDITLGELYAARTATIPGAQSPLDRLFSLDLPVKTAMALRKTLAAVDAELKPFTEQRLALYKRYGKPTKDGFELTPENRQAFAEDLNTLVGIHVDLTITPVPLAAFGEDAKLSANDLARIEPFLVAEAPSKDK